MSGVGEKVWRLGSVGEAAEPSTVIEIDGSLYFLDSLAAPLPDGPRTVLAILDRWEEWEPALVAAAAGEAPPDPLDPERLEWLPPVVYPRKLLCAGANYRDHLDEMKGEEEVRPERPYSFLKPAGTGLLGHRRVLKLPVGATWIDWEAELTVVIGRRMHGLRGKDVLDAIAGYTMLDDVSNRDLMDSWLPIVGMDWITHKGYDNFSPAGPLITPARFVPDVQALDIELSIDGVVKQSSNTAQMIFGVGEILEHVNSIMTLEPGDMVATGSPAGVGFGRDPRERLEDGNVVRISIENLGPALVTPVAGPDPTA